MAKTFASELKKPGKTFRGAPFWAWNAKLEPAELRRQIRIMHKMGLGGFFMHSRVGLNTEYLGRDWFKCIDACVDEARKLGMDAWLYDEDRWPSGAAGGKATRDFPEFRYRFLAMRVRGDEADIEKRDGRTDLAWYAVKGVEGKTISSYRRLDSRDATCADDETHITIAEQVAPNSSWYNDSTYLDTLNPEAVEKFIEITHEKYLAETGAEFGKSIPGVFTDEPNFSSPTPWTVAMPEVFRKRCGYDVMDFLPELFFKVGDQEFSQFRYDFKGTVTHLFVQAFGKLIGDWCGRNNLEYTGHLLSEDTLGAQCDIVGDAMPFYEYMQAPGIDLLTEHWMIYRTAKQCTSMAHQFGRKRRLSETYGCTGWDFSLEGHKALGDWQMALGINLRCQHLAWYSMEAAAKRDYPASIFRQSPWHEIYSVSEDYFARIGAVLSRGEEVRDLLVLHPIESVWGLKIGRDGPAKVGELDASFLNLGSALLGANIDFDYGSEDVMARHARIKGKKLFIARAGYRGIVVPEMLTIRASTLKLLTDFTSAGGPVHYIGKPPAFVDGKPSRAAQIAYRAFAQCTIGEAAAAVAPFARRLSLAQDGVETEATLYLMSQSKEALSVFVCNTSAPMPTPEDEMKFAFVRDRVLEYPGAVLKVFSPKRGDVYEIDTMTAEIHRVAYTHAKGAYEIPCALGRLETRLFVITSEKLGKIRPERSRQVPSANRVELPSRNLKFAMSEPNVMVLDHARCKAEGVAGEDDQFILAIDKELRKALGTGPRSGNMVQPWVAGDRKPDRELDFSLTYKFECAKVPEKAVELCIERPDLYVIKFNGKIVKQKDLGFWMDPSLRRLALTKPKRGVNELTLSGRYHQYLPGLEAIFIRGMFGVAGESVMKAAPTALDIGDWVGQGLENYAGNITYTFSVGKRPAARGRVFLRVPEWRGVALGVSINGGEEHLLPWPPYELDITAELRDMRNTVKVTVYGHRRNACGPFYLKDTKWPYWTGPNEMDQHQVRERGLVPCGLLSPAELLF